MAIVNYKSLCVAGMIISNSALGASPAPSPSPSASPTSVTLASPPASAVGLPIGGSFQNSVQPNLSTGTDQVLSEVLLDILGIGLQALKGLTSPDNTINGTTYTEYDSFGKTVFSQDAILNYANGSFSVGLAPAEIRVPVVVYPVGPVVVEIDGGARFQADLQGQLVPNIGIPITLSSLGIQVQAVADGAGFVEGYANFLIVRAGVGGQVNLVDAQGDLNASVNFNGTAPFFKLDAMVTFLSGDLYAFLDVFDLFGYKRILDYSLYSWNGYCFATGDLLCPQQ